MAHDEKDGTKIEAATAGTFAVVPDRPVPVTIGSGAVCELTKPVTVTEIGDDTIYVLPEAVQPFQLVNDLEVRDNQAGLFHDRPLNQGGITFADGAEKYYTISDAYLMVRQNDDVSAREYLQEVTEGRQKMLTHADLLKNLGISCRHEGLEVAPVLTTDDVRAIVGKSASSDLERKR